MKLSYLSIFFIFFISNCTAPTKLQKISEKRIYQPIKVNYSESITFHAALTNIQNGTIIGYTYDGAARVRYEPIRWKLGMIKGDGQIKVEANRILKSLGYQVPESSDYMFVTDKTSSARYQIGAKVLNYKFNTYLPLAGGFDESEVSILYDLYDTFQDKIVYSTIKQGYGKSDYENAILIAHNDSFYGLLSDPDFVNIVALNSKQSKNKQNRIAEKLFITNSLIEKYSMPESIEYFNSAVVTIETGFTHGSGFFISTDGYLLTAEHVVSGVDRVQIRTNQGFRIPANVVRVNRNSDIALLKANVSSVNFMPIVKQRAGLGVDLYAIGTPIDKNLSNSLAKGIVSSYRNNQSGVEYIQTDLSLNPGNSGGPVFDEDGNVLGVVSWKLSQADGVSFCIEIQHALDILQIELQ